MLLRRLTAPETIKTLQRKVHRKLAEVAGQGPLMSLDAPALEYVSDLQSLAHTLDQADPTQPLTPELLEHWARVQDIRLRPRRP